MSPGPKLQLLRFILVLYVLEGFSAAAKTVEECTPFSRFEEDCNLCACTASGEKRCTIMDCDQENSAAAQGQMDCVAGTIFKEDCNYCSCDALGVKDCTKINCWAVWDPTHVHKPSDDPSQELCLKPKKIGTCKPLRRFWFDAETNQCEGFGYSGCNGNANRFLSEKSCLHRCGAKGAKGAKQQASERSRFW